MLNKIIYYTGKYSPKFRLWHYNKTGKWHWGIITFIHTKSKTIENKKELFLSSEATDWLNKNIKEVFKIR